MQSFGHYGLNAPVELIERADAIFVIANMPSRAKECTIKDEVIRAKLGSEAGSSTAG